MDTNTETATTLNTHCIVCGGAFATARMSKLYCSPRCKQFGYNHKEAITQVIGSRDKGISPEPKLFLINGFIEYNADQKNIKRYHELKRKQEQWGNLNEEINNLLNNRLAVSNYAIESLANKTLTDIEENLLDDLEEIDDETKILDLKELSLEQWSFMKSLYPEKKKSFSIKSFLQLAKILSDNSI